MARHSVPSDRM